VALLRGRAVDLLRLGIIARDADTAPQTHAKVVLRIKIAERCCAPKESHRLRVISRRG
jgi:hypothetical protein